MLQQIWQYFQNNVKKKKKKCVLQNVNPDPKKSCGPYHPSSNLLEESTRKDKGIGYLNHDTIGMVAVDTNGHVVSGTTTNGLNHKIPGYVLKWDATFCDYFFFCVWEIW